MESADVFLTNFRPQARTKLKIDVEDIRAVNPDIIYVRGSANGQRGPESKRGGYENSTFWGRGGSADILSAPGEYPTSQPGPGYGDVIGGLTIAGGVSAALFHRQRTGEAVTVDNSLLANGIWATGATVWPPTSSGSAACHAGTGPRCRIRWSITTRPRTTASCPSSCSNQTGSGPTWSSRSVDRSWPMIPASWTRWCGPRTARSALSPSTRSSPVAPLTSGSRSSSRWKGCGLRYRRPASCWRTLGPRQRLHPRGHLGVGDDLPHGGVTAAVQ